MRCRSPHQVITMRCDRMPNQSGDKFLPVLYGLHKWEGLSSSSLLSWREGMYHAIRYVSVTEHYAASIGCEAFLNQSETHR